MSDKKHYYLVAGNVIIANGDQVQAIPQNALLILDEPNVGVRGIGRAQQSLQVTLFKKMDDASINVVDVIIMSISHLGHMSEEEFQAPIPGTEVQERASASAEVIDITAELKDRG